MAQWILPSDNRWKSLLLETKHDFYHLPCYLELASAYDHGEPKAFYTELASGRLLIPLLIRKIPSEIFPYSGLLDATSPYGYPGPLFTPGISTYDAEKGIRDFVQFGKKNGLVTTFLRLHPLLSKNIFKMLTNDYRSIIPVSHGSTVSIDLTLDTKELDSRLRKNHRRNIKKLYKMGFSSRFDNWDDYSEFIDLYHQTMHRCEASSYYFFDREYFSRLRECLGTTLHLCAIISPDGDMASGGLNVTTDDIVQGHLNATADRYLSLAPSKLMFYETRNRAKLDGANIFHLGGGVGGGRDSLFYYKLGLGTHEHQFSTIGVIHDEKAYQTIYESWTHTCESKARSDTLFFPFYRSMVLEAG
jgi:hypothetical protein